MKLICWYCAGLEELENAKGEFVPCFFCCPHVRVTVRSKVDYGFNQKKAMDAAVSKFESLMEKSS